MSNFLQLCQRLREEAGVAGSGPTAVTSQSGMYLKLVNWTARAWVDIQASKPYWKFLRTTYSGALVAGTRDYSIVNDLALISLDKIDPNGISIYLTNADDRSDIELASYPDFRRRYPRVAVSARPKVVTEIPGGTLRFESTPDEAYTLNLDYWMTPELLAANGDVPALPEQFHDLIVWRALKMFAGAEGAPELFNYAQSMYGPMYIQLALDQTETPTAVKSFPIATGRLNGSDTRSWGS